MYVCICFAGLYVLFRYYLLYVFRYLFLAVLMHFVILLFRYDCVRSSVIYVLLSFFSYLFISFLL